MLRPKYTANTECNMVMDILFTLGTSFIQVKKNVSKAIHKCHYISNKFCFSLKGGIEIISLVQEFGKVW